MQAFAADDPLEPSCREPTPAQSAEPSPPAFEVGRRSGGFGRRWLAGNPSCVTAEPLGRVSSGFADGLRNLWVAALFDGLRRGLWATNQCGPWPLAEDDRPQRASIGLGQTAPRRAVVRVELVVPPCVADFGVRAVFENVHPAFDFDCLLGIVRVEVLPELTEDGAGPNPNLCPMFLLLLRRQCVEPGRGCDLVCHRGLLRLL